MFRSSGNFDKFLDKATSHLLMDPDWPSILQICDLIRQNDIQPKYALNALKKKLFSTNQHTAMFALLVLESMVKNCGYPLHEELTTRTFCETLYDLAKTTTHENVRQKVSELIQVWNEVFCKNPKHGALKDIVLQMKSDGFKFPAIRESDAMFSADSAPDWADGDVCHRCRISFSLIHRKHHCRACGQVFCQQCSQKTTTLPKYGIEKDVRVCDACYDQVTKPSAASKAAAEKQESELPAEYLNSSLAQQSQTPARKTEDELTEEEELNLVLAISQSEAEAKEKEKEKFKLMNAYKAPVERSPSPVEEQTNPELAKYLNRSFWESLNQNDGEGRATSPSAPATAPDPLPESKPKNKENGVHVDLDLEEFIAALKSQVEIFINRMKSNSSRGRSIANDSGVQSLFMNITAMHSRLLRYLQQHDDSRMHYERLQDKLTQVKDARAALDDLREEHREKLKREAEEAERQRQQQMAHKLEIMRKKKQEYLQYQRHLALQRIEEQEREMQMRQEHQKQQYLMGYMGASQFGAVPGGAPLQPPFHGYQYGQAMMPHPGVRPHMPHQMPPPPPHFQPLPNYSMPPISGQPPMMGMPNQMPMPAQNPGGPAPGRFPLPQPQPQPVDKSETRTAELISFDD